MHRLTCMCSMHSFDCNIDACEYACTLAVHYNCIGKTYILWHKYGHCGKLLLKCAHEKGDTCFSTTMIFVIKAPSALWVSTCNALSLQVSHQHSIYSTIIKVLDVRSFYASGTVIFSVPLRCATDGNPKMTPSTVTNWWMPISCYAHVATIDAEVDASHVLKFMVNLKHLENHCISMQ